MRLLRLRLSACEPFVDTSFPFCDDEGTPRSVTIIHGAGGVGKTSILSAIASTRPGNAVAQQRRPPLATR
jgi:DNA repair exonuclease SbcCD ATPase subunit